jgi:predicted MFS family arabinose efflux permease
MYAGLRWHHHPARTVLLLSCGLMAATGTGFGIFTRFWPLLAVAVVGTINPSGGDVSIFLPTEQAALADSTPGDRRTAAFARYNLSGGIGAALGALCSALPNRIATATGWDTATVQRSAFGVYVACALIAALAYRTLPKPAAPAAEPDAESPDDARRRPALHTSRRVVVRLATLFSIDAAGGGLVVQSLLVVYLSQRFGFDATTIAAVLAVTAFASAFSQLASARLAARIGLVRTMVFTHLPANVCLVLAGIVGNGTLAVTFLVLRSFVSAMDVPARQALVMAVVDPSERAAAASITNVPRSLASAATPLLAGVLLRHSSFGWPLVIGGTMKAIYDLLLLRESLDHDLR